MGQGGELWRIYSFPLASNVDEFVSYKNTENRYRNMYVSIKDC